MEEERGVTFEALSRAFSTEEYERYCLTALRDKDIGNGMSVVA